MSDITNVISLMAIYFIGNKIILFWHALSMKVKYRKLFV